MFQVEFQGEDGICSYVIAHRDGRAALIVDPLEEAIAGYQRLLASLEYRLGYTLETGSIARAAVAADVLAASLGSARVVPCDAGRDDVAIRVGHGDLLHIGDLDVHVVGRIAEPNETVAYHVGDRVFTGTLDLRDRPEMLALPLDTLIHRGCAIRGTQLGLVGLETRASTCDRVRWRATRGREWKRGALSLR